MEHSQSLFASVVFDQVAETYPTDANVEISYTVTPSLQPTKWDWLGLYKVGWTKQKDYLTYVYAPLPEKYEQGKPAKSKAVFAAGNLPKEDGEFFQFCYISYPLGVSGASTPFQFKKPSAADFVEEEHDDMLFIRSKQTVMQEKIQTLEHELLIKKKEHDEMVQTRKALEKKVKDRDVLIETLQVELKDCRQSEKKMAEANKVMESTTHKLQGMLECVFQEKEDCANAMLKETMKIKQKEEEIRRLETTIKGLQAEKDELSGRNQSLMNELDCYKAQVTESQTLAVSRGKTIEELNDALERALSQKREVQAHAEKVDQTRKQKEEELEKARKELHSVTAEKIELEKRYDEADGELFNANDKLLASETMRDKLADTVKAYEATQKNFNCQFEKHESDIRHLQDVQKKTSGQLETANKDLEEARKEVWRRNEVLNEMKTKFSQVNEALEQNAACLQEATKKVAAAEQEASMVRQQLSLVQAQLEKVSEEKTTMTLQLESFEEELKETIVTKNKEVADKAAELEAKTHLLQEKESEIAKMAENIEELTQLIEERDTRIAAVTAALDHSSQLLAQTNEEKERENLVVEEKLQAAEKTNKELAVQLESSKEDEGSKFALMTANKSLQSRLDEKEKELLTLRQAKSRYMIQLTEQERELEDMRERLSMAREEYCKLYKTKRKLEKANKTKSRPVTSSTEASPNSSCASEASASGDEDKAHKYKQLYQQEKKARETMEQHLREELEKKEDIITNLETEADNLLQYVKKVQEENKCLMNFNFQKDTHIEELTNKLRGLEVHDDLLCVAPAAVDVTSVSSCEEEETAEVELQFGNPYEVNVVTPAESEEKLPAPTEADEPVIFWPTTESVDYMHPIYTAAKEGDLPTPLEPEVMPDAKVAAVKQLVKGASHSDTEEQMPDLCSEEEKPDDLQLEANHDLYEDCQGEESFMDAIGEAMKICPHCQTSIFSPALYEEHMATHFGRICPVCKRAADDTMSEIDFEHHVNKCLDMEKADTEEGVSQ